MCGNNKDEKKEREENETKLSFCLEQCIVDNKPKTDTRTHAQTHTHMYEYVAH